MVGPTQNTPREGFLQLLPNVSSIQSSVPITASMSALVLLPMHGQTLLAES